MALLLRAGPWSAIRAAKRKSSPIAPLMVARSVFIRGTRWEAAASITAWIILITSGTLARRISFRRVCSAAAHSARTAPSVPTPSFIENRLRFAIEEASFSVGWLSFIGRELHEADHLRLYRRSALRIARLTEPAQLVRKGTASEVEPA